MYEFSTNRHFNNIAPENDPETVKAIENAVRNGIPDGNQTEIGAVVQFKTIKSHNKTFILAEVVRLIEGEKWWALLEQGSDSYCWVAAASELVDFVNEDEIIFKAQYNIANAYKFYPYYLYCMRVGDAWETWTEDAYLKFGESIDFGYPGMDSPDNEELNEFFDCAIGFDGVQIATNTIGNDAGPYVYITSDISTKTMTIRLKNCTCKNETIKSGNNFSAVEKVSVKSDGHDTVLTLSLRSFDEKIRYIVHEKLLTNSSSGLYQKTIEITFGKTP